MRIFCPAPIREQSGTRYRRGAGNFMRSATGWGCAVSRSVGTAGRREPGTETIRGLMITGGDI